ncbi:stage III sporulation protein AG [Clostridium chauvoei]|uniref:Stage III sporulation protein AG n=2 Tax=Clostridium chauvoei TaxID=46867 RepID=A0ABD4RE61_9CLOT|nr:stage III sporulation protein AG [Clostridium chauvoei]ATD55193.1 stage III sporulation protein AG [Clostridium chauvoei]ATD57135.1 stage III sporulation protein AG [Clostridium chauvoei]MBX7279537.1 stage III sporulation protein AG [Clostridium chauvoei]MBX7281906.1 stage III sporulation protein AG [Clostridium chauvoei]MBX7284505.1 stage III sporulation protein AG [Clostridium chauvoei]
MGKDNFKKEVAGILNNPKFLNIVSIALVIAFVLLAISFLSNNRKKEVKETDGTNISEQGNEDKSNVPKEILDYEEQQKKNLKDILSKMHGVGEVEVMMYFETGEIKVPAMNENKQVSETEESDKDGGKRLNTQKNDGSEVVMSGNGSENEPFILKTYKPQITGIVIVAEGAESSKIKYDIQTAVASLYGISLDKVNVYSMKS